MKHLKHIHAKCSDILEMIENAERNADHHTTAKQMFDLDWSDKHHAKRLKINLAIIERLKSYYLNQIQKITK
jgi:hypothetical protein